MQKDRNNFLPAIISGYFFSTIVLFPQGFIYQATFCHLHVIFQMLHLKAQYGYKLKALFENAGCFQQRVYKPMQAFKVY